MKLKIGNIELANNVLTAPMAGVSDRAYRDILHEMGAGLVCSEMISDKALCYDNKNTLELVNFAGETGMISAQLHGSDPLYMGRATKLLTQYPVEIIDINMGCPVPKIIKNKAGSSLMLDPSRAFEIVRAVVDNTDKPVTVKIRLGWDEDSKNAVEFAKGLEFSGASAIAVHGRTRNQYYSGVADWGEIKKVVEAVNIPVIGNGDIFSGVDALRMLEETSCAGVMLGRGIMGNPWLVRDVINAIDGREIIGKPEQAEVIKMAISHLKRQVELSGEYLGIRKMRSHLAWYLKGMRGSAVLKDKINKLESVDEIVEVLNDFVQS